MMRTLFGSGNTEAAACPASGDTDGDSALPASLVGVFDAEFNDLKAVFESDITKPIEWRKSVLRQLEAMLRENHTQLIDSVIEDLGGGCVRPTFEFNMLGEIQNVLTNLSKWAADRPAPLGDPLTEVPFLDKRVIRPTPKGVVLILSAWNFSESCHPLKEPTL